MKTAKLGAIFLISIMALAGAGAGYAAWTDTITIEGEVNTGSVSWEVTGYSCTYVWKVHGLLETENPDWGSEIYVDYAHVTEVESHAFVQKRYPTYTIELISYAEAKKGTDYDVDVIFKNLFPCIWFKADIVIHYTGTVPGKINSITHDLISDTLGIYDLMVSRNMYFKAYDAKGVIIPIEELPGYQLHFCDTITIELWIHIPQNNDLMLKNAAGTVSVEVIQWNEY